ncbi:MAG: acyl-CoA carboxylase subunit beta [Deltaproteobacteria bacterium]|nr:acyl-CoA carboxylase subunit beta [Deltaproteobacteria bacterium]
MEMNRGLQKLDELKTRARLGGGKDKQDKLRQEGKLTAWERIKSLVDRDTFLELNTLAEMMPTEFGPSPKPVPGDGVVTGFGKVGGRQVAIFAHDRTVMGGSLGNVQAAKITAVLQKAGEMGIPVIGLQDSVGARIQEGNKNVGFDAIFRAITRSSGIIPQISAIFGTCAGGVAYASGLMDFVLMVRKKSHLFITGPNVIRAVTHEEIDVEGLGGADVHMDKSGICDLAADDDDGCIALIRKLLGYLPDNCYQLPPDVPTRDDPGRTNDELVDFIPSDPRKYYDVRKLIKNIADDQEFLEIKPRFARNIVVGFARLAGRTLGVVANQPRHLAGSLDVDGSDKAARFIRFCDCFHIPILTLVDVPGFLPGVDQEHRGIIRHGAKMLYAYAESDVPKVTLILRKNYGGGKQAMCSKPIGSDLVLAWPTAELAVMGAEGAVDVICRREIGQSDDPEQTRQRLIREYEEIFGGPFESARKMYVDDVIRPRDTRRILIRAFEILIQKRFSHLKRMHGNMPV